MPCVIRKTLNDRFENYAEVASNEWRLRELVEALEVWLRDHRHELGRPFKWVADIGFHIRPDAAGGGPPIGRELMTMCLEANLEIYLSEYPGDP